MMDCGLLVIVMGIGAFVAFCLGGALGVWSDRLFCREEREAKVYVVIRDDGVTVRDVFVVLDRGVAEQLQTCLWMRLADGTPVGYVSIETCRIDDIPEPYDDVVRKRAAEVATQNSAQD